MLDNFILLFNFSIVLPILIWMFRRNEIPSIFLVFVFHLFAGLGNELIHVFCNTDQTNNLSSFAYYLIETQCILYLFLKWNNTPIKTIRLYQILFLLIWVIDGISYFKQEGIHYKWMYIILLIMLAIHGIKLMANNAFVRYKYQYFIIIPFVIYAIYFIVLQILMYFLYDKEHQELFITLYSAINIINFLTYISYTLAILWAPKKEQYL